MLSVSIIIKKKKTIYRRMERYGLRALNVSNISDDELERYVTETGKTYFPFCGEQILKFPHKKETSKEFHENSNPENSDPLIFFLPLILVSNLST